MDSRGLAPAGLALASAPGTSAGPVPTNLREATQEFESLFIAQMLDAMRRTAPESGLLSASAGHGIFRQMLDQELAHRIAASGGFGVGEMLYQELAANQPSTKGSQQEHRDADR